MKVRVSISKRAAILARKATAGILQVDILDEHLAEATEEALVELSAVAENDELIELGIGEATPEAVMRVMEARALERLTNEAEASRQATAVAAAIEENAAENKAKAAARTAALHKWIKSNGTDEQKSRLEENLLPESEILEDVTDDVFQISEDDYVPLRKEQACDCEKGCAGSARFAVSRANEGLNAKQYEILERIREQAPDNATVEVVQHRVSCPECNCAPLSRLSARVSIEWEGWRLVKEYALK
jgi:hypothetical protein